MSESTIQLAGTPEDDAVPCQIDALYDLVAGLDEGHQAELDGLLEKAVAYGSVQSSHATVQALIFVLSGWAPDGTTWSEWEDKHGE